MIEGYEFSFAREKELDAFSDEIGFKGRRGRYRNDGKYKNYFYGGSLFAVLIWGSAFLILSISKLKETIDATHPSNDILGIFPLDDSCFIGDDTEKLLPYGFTEDNRTRLNFTAVRDGKFRPEFKQFQWIKDPLSKIDDKATFVVKEEENGEDDDSLSVRYVIKSIVDDDYEFVLFNKSSFDYDGITYEIDSLVASPDLSKALLKTNTTKNWRHSSFALYWIVDVSTRSIEPVVNTDNKLSIVSWSPVSTHVAYVYRNNVYVKDIASLIIEKVTFDGDTQVFNGIPDWVYEEEVFASDIALWWSLDGNKISFLRTNETLVPTFTIPYYVQEAADDYPEYKDIKYPKAGYPNPIVDIVIFSLSSVDSKTPTSRVLSLDASSIDEKIITQVLWVSNEQLLVKVTNRAGDKLEVFLIDAENDTSSLVREHIAKNRWLDVTSNSLYIPRDESNGRSEDGYIDTVDVDGYSHLAYFSPPHSSTPNYLTKGEWEVIGGVSSFDYQTNEVYFISTAKSSVERHISSVNLLDSSKHDSRELTYKNISDTQHEGWYSGSFSSGSQYLLLNYHGPKTPHQTLINLRNFSDVKVVEDNQILKDNVDQYLLPEVKYDYISLGFDEETGKEVFANSVETLPPNFDPTKKYPVLFYVYGGPGSQLVKKMFEVSFSAAVASELNCVVVTVDGRGTGFTTKEHKYVVRDKLGHFEPRDQIAAAKKWAAKSYVDPERIAIWGWSYGGFLTLKTLETDFDDRIFSFGAAVAPVTKWKFYDSIYTERYMRTPQENPQGYEVASISNVTNFDSVKRFLIMHGSGDDNVHFQNTLKLLDEFNQERIENFDFMVFPDSDHSISYHNANQVVFDRLIDWLSNAFLGSFT